MSNLIEAGIEPLVNALNGLDFIKTIYSCEGHFAQPANPKFLPTAYITFSTTDLEKFKKLYEQICHMNKSDNSVSLRMTYDCILGLYTLSIWPETSSGTVSRKRAAVDGAVECLANMVLEYMRHPVSISSEEESVDAHTAYPCAEAHPPCMLVIPPRELTCPFNQPA